MLSVAAVCLLFVSSALSIVIPVSPDPGEGYLGYFVTDKCDGEMYAVAHYFNGLADFTYVDGATSLDAISCFTNPHGDVCAYEPTRSLLSVFLTLISQGPWFS